MATRLSVSRGVIANIEYAKAPVRADVGLKLCYSLLISERWLATGEKPARPCAGLDGHDLLVSLDFRKSFFEVYAEYLAPLYELYSRRELFQKLTGVLKHSSVLDRPRFELALAYVSGLVLDAIDAREPQKASYELPMKFSFVTDLMTCIQGYCKNMNITLDVSGPSSW